MGASFPSLGFIRAFRRHVGLKVSAESVLNVRMLVRVLKKCIFLVLQSGYNFIIVNLGNVYLSEIGWLPASRNGAVLEDATSFFAQSAY